ncbi:MAG: N-acetyltransferase [Lachnospiraceae bacterium]|nr:N-acetyltransferase [Lachnospiraceae bacterium]MBQ8813036.1 N-acetyltransferase [Lachnospiraceae bacterium]
MKRTIKHMEHNYLQKSLDMVETVFTEYDCAAEGRLVRALAEEIRSKRFYLPELELIVVDESDEVIGYVMFSRFHLNGKYEDELLLLSPVAVKTAVQRRHISKELIEYGFARAKELGFKAVIVEGNPQNYRARGFVTAADHGILPGKSVKLPAIECLMVKELEEGALEYINGEVEYTDYETLS